MSIHTILFDLDGTLIDTNELIIASFIHTFKHYNKGFTREEIIEFNGPPLRETFENTFPDQAEEMIETYREHNLFHHDDYVKVFPNVIETLDRLKKENIQLGIVTTKMRKTAEKGMKITGIDGYFDVIIALDDVQHAKPHPEPVEKAMKMFNADPSTTLMVGDNPHDINSGINAGVKTAGVAWTFKGKERLQAFHPTYMLDDMEDLLKIVEV